MLIICFFVSVKVLRWLRETSWTLINPMYTCVVWITVMSCRHQHPSPSKIPVLC